MKKEREKKLTRSDTEARFYLDSTGKVQAQRSIFNAYKFLIFLYRTLRVFLFLDFWVLHLLLRLRWMVSNGVCGEEHRKSKICTEHNIHFCVA